MRKSLVKTMTLIALIALAAGCEPAGPTAAPVLPTSTLAPAPPAQILSTATPGPPAGTVDIRDP